MDVYFRAVYCDSIDVGATGENEIGEYGAKIVRPRFGGTGGSDMPKPGWSYDLHKSSPSSPWHC